MDIKDVLLSKGELDTLGHFYILRAQNGTCLPKQLLDWTLDLVAKYNSKNGSKFTIDNILNHEDVLLIDKEETDNTQYKLNDFNEVFSFFSYRATRSDRKFIIINNAEKIPTNLSNKLLKTLEEPPVKATIFLLNPKSIALLETVISRSIQLRIPLKKEITNNTINIISDLKEQFVAGLNIDEFVNLYKFDKDKEEEVFLAFTDWITHNNINAKTLWEMEALNHQFREDQIYHSAPLNRLFKLYQLMHTAFLK